LQRGHAGRRQAALSPLEFNPAPYSLFARLEHAKSAQAAFALEQDEIERGAITGNRRHQAVSLPAMVGLVVEK
jgi:hypothetical protein